MPSWTSFLVLLLKLDHCTNIHACRNDYAADSHINFGQTFNYWNMYVLCCYRYQEHGKHEFAVKAYEQVIIVS